MAAGNFNANHILRVNSKICEHSNDDYKNMKNILNYGSETMLCMENEKDYIENFKKTLKFDRKRYVTKPLPKFTTSLYLSKKTN